MLCVSLTGEEKLDLAFLSEILFFLRNGTSFSHLSYCSFSAGEGYKAESTGSCESFPGMEF